MRHAMRFQIAALLFVLAPCILADPLGQAVSTVQLDTITGAMSTSGTVTTAGVSGSDIVVDPTGHFVYIGNAATGLIAGFTADTKGTLTPMVGSPFSTPFLTDTQRGGAISLALDSAGKYLYAVSGVASQITGFRIDQNTGVLSAMAGGPIATGSKPFRVVLGP